MLRGRRTLGGGEGFKGVRLHRKNPAHAGVGLLSLVQEIWKRLRVAGSRVRHDVAKVPLLHQGDEAHEALDRVGVG